MRTEIKKLNIARSRSGFLSFLDRFWIRVKTGKKNDCWPWIGMRSKLGYGKFYLRGKSLWSHRVSYELHNGKPPKGKHVLHKCDNPPCCNPEHLFLGTQADNMADKMAKGRHRVLFGSAHADATIDEECAIKVARKIRDGQTCASIARELNISVWVCYNIKWNRSWRHIN